jgi:hypothetical protein
MTREPKGAVKGSPLFPAKPRSAGTFRVYRCSGRRKIAVSGAQHLEDLQRRRPSLEQP